MAKDGDWKDKDYAAHYNELYATSAKEFAPCLEALDLKPEDSIIDFGCGNGSFLALAAAKVNKALGIDISEPQLAEAKKNLQGLNNVELLLTEFMKFNPGQRKFTKGFSRKALHHLTNPEKQQFLINISPAFKKNAIFLMEDGIYFDFPRSEIQQNMPRLIKACEEYYGSSWEAKKKDLLHSFNEEFAAGASEWESFFANAGWKVILKKPASIFYGTIIAIKQ